MFVALKKRIPLKMCILSCFMSLKGILLNRLCVFHLFSECWQSTLFQIFCVLSVCACVCVCSKKMYAPRTNLSSLNQLLPRAGSALNPVGILGLPAKLHLLPGGIFEDIAFTYLTNTTGMAVPWSGWHWNNYDNEHSVWPCAAASNRVDLRCVTCCRPYNHVSLQGKSCLGFCVLLCLKFVVTLVLTFPPASLPGKVLIKPFSTRESAKVFFIFLYSIFYLYNCIVLLGFLPLEIQVAFPRENQLRQES